ncbi:MAG: hypothetical protein GX087_07820 [Desulfobulbaceae bacterium]|nr:hypothetical protein [Desulfobulbaceae bacterium]
MELKLPPELVVEMEAIYTAMAAGYDTVAEAIGLTCDQCPDNCCDSWFLHYTYSEWAYLWLGLAQLDPARLETICQRASEYVHLSQQALAADTRPQTMCPLNEAGRCQLYHHRLMICRSHGVPATLTSPNGRRQRFPGCFRCQEMVHARYSPPELAPAMERTALLRRLVQVEQQLLGAGRAQYPKIRLSIAEMIVQGPPQRHDG